jgi:translation elongation factor EF-1beta
MNDKNIDQLEYVNVKVTPESMEVHLHVLKENGYAIQKRAYIFTT